MEEGTIVELEEEEVLQVWVLGIWDLGSVNPMLVLTKLAAGRGRGSAEYSGPFPNFPNAPVDPSQLISGYGPALVSDSLNPMSR